MSPGIFSWNELMTKDGTGSTKFYTELLGWSAESMDMGPGMKYTFFKQGEQPVGGMFEMPSEAQGSNLWMSYVTVSDLAATVQKATNLGARVLKDVTKLPMGSLAIILDPQGAVIGLWEFAEEK